MSTFNNRIRNIYKQFSNKGYRDAYVEAHIDEGLADQIRTLRKHRGWTQNQLAKKIGTKQTAISRLENPNYGQLSIDTLKKIATVFDIALLVRFISFSELANRTANLNESDLNVPSFMDDSGISRYINVKGVDCLTKTIETNLQVNSSASLNRITLSLAAG